MMFRSLLRSFLYDGASGTVKTKSMKVRRQEEAEAKEEKDS